MEWQAVVLAVQILLLAAGWLLFQRARGELSVRAAETPVLAEVRALQKSVKQLLIEIESAADRQSLRLENGCSDAAAILVEMENKIKGAEQCLEQYEARMRAIGPSRADVDERSEIHSERATHRLAGEHGATAARYSGHRRLEPAERTSTNYPDMPGAAQIATSHHDKVFHLADSGETTTAIARATRLSEGEIETLLRLRTLR